MNAGRAYRFLPGLVGVVLLIVGCSDPTTSPELSTDESQTQRVQNTAEAAPNELVHLQAGELEQLLRPALLSFAAEYSIDSAMQAIQFQPMTQATSAVEEADVSVHALPAGDGLPAGVEIQGDGHAAAVWRYSHNRNQQTILDVRFVQSNSGPRLVILSEASRFYSASGDVLQLKSSLPNPNDYIGSGVVVTWLDLSDVRQPRKLEQIDVSGAAVNFDWQDGDLHLITAQLAWVPGLLDANSRLADQPQSLLDELRLPQVFAEPNERAGCLSDLSLSLAIYHVLQLSGSEGQVINDQCIHGALQNLDLSKARTDGVYRFAM